MAKLIKLLMICMLLNSCNKHSYDKEENDIVFIYNDWIKIDLKSKAINLDYVGLHYKDTLNITKREEDEIIRSFEKNKINEIKGNVIYASKNYLEMPPIGLKIKLFYKKKLKSEMFVEYSYPVKTSLPMTQEDRVVNFRNDVVKILNKNDQVEKAKKVCIKYQTDNKLFNL